MARELITKDERINKNTMYTVSANADDTMSFQNIGCPISSIAQCAMREAAPHARGVSKARQFYEG
jgi:hypothetical protein